MGVQVEPCFVLEAHLNGGHVAGHLHLQEKEAPKLKAFGLLSQADR